MTEPKAMKQLHTIREKNHERMSKLSVDEQIKSIQREAEPVKKRLLEKMKEKKLPVR